MELRNQSGSRIPQSGQPTKPARLGNSYLLKKGVAAKTKKVVVPKGFLYHNTQAWVNMKHLEEEGYVVIPFLSEREIKIEKDAFKTALTQMTDVFKNPQQMIRDDETFQYLSEQKNPQSATAMLVGGGFAALGNPASFHNQFVRKLRARIHQHVIDMVFKPKLISDPELKFEQIIDRMMFRRPDQEVTEEKWHRDEADAGDDDDVFGGWINLDLKDDTKEYSGNQIFSAAPTTHIGLKNIKKGFGKIPENERPGLRKLKKRIVIPPGYVLIFYERLAHEVAKSESKVDRFRLFLGWRLTESENSVIPELNSLLDDQKAMPLKSGQAARMKPKLWWATSSFKDQAWSTTYVQDRHIVTKTFKGGKKKGQTRNVIRDVITQGIPDLVPRAERDNFPEYSEEERDLYKPTRLGLSDDTRIDLSPIFDTWKTARVTVDDIKKKELDCSTTTMKTATKKKRAETKKKTVIKKRKNKVKKRKIDTEEEEAEEEEEKQYKPKKVKKKKKKRKLYSEEDDEEWVP